MASTTGRIRDSTGSSRRLILSHLPAHRATVRALARHHVRLRPWQRALEELSRSRDEKSIIHHCALTHRPREPRWLQGVMAVQ